MIMLSTSFLLMLSTKTNKHCGLHLVTENPNRPHLKTYFTNGSGCWYRLGRRCGYFDHSSVLGSYALGSAFPVPYMTAASTVRNFNMPFSTALDVQLHPPSSVSLLSVLRGVRLRNCLIRWGYLLSIDTLDL